LRRRRKRIWGKNKEEVLDLALGGGG